MLQKTLITVGASLTAVVLLLLMIQRKKPRPVAGKSSGSKKGAGQANNNKDAGPSKDDVKSDVSGKTTEVVVVAPNGVVMKTAGDSKEEEVGSSDKASKKVLVEALMKPLVQELSKAKCVEIAYQETSCEESLVQQRLVQDKLSNALGSKSACTLQNTPATEQVSNSSVIEQIPTNAVKSGYELPAVQDVATASEPGDECHVQQQKQIITACEPIKDCPLQQQKLVNEHSDKEQSTDLNKQVDGCNSTKTSISEVSVPSSIEQSTSGDNKLLSQDESDRHTHNLTTDLSELPADEQKCADIEQENKDTDKQEVKVESKEFVLSENSIEKNESPSKKAVTIADEQHSSTESPCLSNSHNLSLQSSSLQSNGGHVEEHSQAESEQSNGESCQEISSPELKQSNSEPLQEPVHLESGKSNGKTAKSASCFESGHSNGKPVEKTSKSESEQVNGGSIKEASGTVEQTNGKSIKPDSDVEHYYDNHKVILPGKPNNTYRRGDYRKMWPQPQDGLIFVKSSAGQPLVPQYLRDTDYLTNRTIPVHEPATTAFLYTNMNKLVYPPENWVRIISVSENLELRVRHDERDMLLEQLERKGVCDTQSKPPPPRLLTVGSLVAAHLDVPQRGLIWCRAHITAVLPVTGNQDSKGSCDVNAVPPITGPSGRRKGRQPQPQHQPQPLFMVESIDHFPAASAEPVRASELRPLAAHALQAPFYDQLFCLLNTMPADAVEYGSSARDLLLEQLRAGHNFLRVTGPVHCTFVNGACYWMTPLAAVQTKEGSSAECLLEEELQQSEHAMAIYSGRVLDGLPFDKCIFRDGEAFWIDDDRCPSPLKPSCGPPNPQQEYLWLRRTDPRIIQAFRGFKLPYKHAKHQFKRMGFNMSLHEYYTVYRHHSSTVLLTADPDKVLKVVLDDPKALVILDFHMQTLIRFYHFDPKMMEDPEAHVAKDNTPMHMLSFPKDDNGFLILGNTFFSDFTKENLRIPVMPF